MSSISPSDSFTNTTNAPPNSTELPTTTSPSTTLPSIPVETSTPSFTTPATPSSKHNSSNLYLVTFLATLFLLLFVSCAIVFRSYLLRRRYQRQLEIARANGILLTPRAPGSRKKRFGMKPRMFESWVMPLFVGGWNGYQPAPRDKGDEDVKGDRLAYEKDVKRSFEKESRDGWEYKPLERCEGKWCDMLPVTVQTVIVKRRMKDPNAQNNAQNASPSPSPTAESPSTPLPSARPRPSSVQFASLEEQANQLRMNRQTRSPRTSGMLEFPHPYLNINTAFGDRTQGQSSASAPVSPVTPGSIVSPVSPVSTVWSPTSPDDDDGDDATLDGNAARNSVSSRQQQETQPPRPRRESATTWRAIVDPSPSLPPPVTPRPQAESSRSAGLKAALGKLPIPVFGRRADEGQASTSGGVPGDAPPSPASTSAPQGVPGKDGKYRIRTEMLQISVFVAMPDVKTSRLYGDASVVKKTYGSHVHNIVKAVKNSSKQHPSRKSIGKKHRKSLANSEGSEKYGDVDEIVEAHGDHEEEYSSEEEEEEEEGESLLPNLVLGVTRLNYRPPNAAAAAAAPNGAGALDDSKTQSPAMAQTDPPLILVTTASPTSTMIPR